MTTATQPLPAKRKTSSRELKVITHTPLLYWWPVFVVGYLMAFWTYWEDSHVALVPAGTVVHLAATPSCIRP